MVYEASALARQSQAARQRPGGYRLLVPDPTIETVLAAAVLRGAASGSEEDGERFAAFLAGPEAQAVLMRHGFRRPDGSGGTRWPGVCGVCRHRRRRRGTSCCATGNRPAEPGFAGSRFGRCRAAPGPVRRGTGAGRRRPGSSANSGARSLPPVVLSCDALFLSDLHLGSNQCEAGPLAAFLGCIRPRHLVLVGDIIDLQAIRFNAGIDGASLTGLIDGLLEGDARGIAEEEELKRLLRASHRRVLERFQELHREGVEITFIPGNHDAHLRRHAGLERPGFRIRRQVLYTTPSGLRLLVRHGDEYDRLIRFHAGLAESLARLQEHYSAGINGLCSPFHGSVRSPLPAGWNAEAILAGAVELLASHREWPIPVSRGLNSSGGFSLAFALESALKSRIGHDRLIKRRILQHLRRAAQGAEPLDGLINGHTHIPEVTPLALGEPGRPAAGRCHITYYNTGSWARSQRRLGRTALVVGHDGSVGMVRYDRRRGIEPFQPPRFPFNTYPMQPCQGCGLGVAQLVGS
ncbi:MAG: hypothetical protein ER33_15135 [Cyanobium sp. CACIAM 14]|nr:MAG: hypothetical protein ER33_15135 [Cyanobium sp. CACIAM 14]